MTLAIVHADGQHIVQDVMKAWGRRSAREGIVQEVADTLKAYELSRVHGDRYAAQWVVEAFKRHGITYEHAQIRKDGELTYLDRSSAYLECEPLFASGLITMLDHPQMARELVILERRPSQSGRDRIDHPRGKHDDHANALALAAALASRGSVGKSGFGGGVMVLERKVLTLPEAMQRLRERLQRWPTRETFVDLRGEDPTHEPTSPNPDPWGRRGTSNPWGRPA